jgi:nucleotide-binding universal stress UspA family protein
VQLAAETGTALEVLHVVQDDLPAIVVDRRTAEATAVINSELSTVPRSAAEAIKVSVLVGKDYTDILDHAEKSAAGLIILGVHREDALRRVVIGTTAERLIGFGSRPVLVVKNRPAGRYRRIVVGADFSSSARRAAAFAFELAPASDFHLVHAAPITASARSASGSNAAGLEKIHSDLRALLPSTEGHLAQVHPVVCYGPPIAVIRDAVMDVNADLVVVGAQRRSGLTRAIIGEIPEDLLAQPPCDIMAVHA